VTWGKAYELTDEIAYEYLEQREGALGGYTHALTWFWPSEKSETMEKVQVLVYMSTPDSPHWLGPANMDSLAIQVATSRGASGHNAEYVLRLADFMRETFPDQTDEHLYELEALVLCELSRVALTRDEVMNTKGRIDPALVSLQEAHDQKEKLRHRNSAPAKLHVHRTSVGQCNGMRCLKL
jgi:cation transport protein ChaC